MKIYRLMTADKTTTIGDFTDKQSAVEAMESVISDNNECLDPDDEDWATPFDYVCEEIERQEVNEEITDFEAARKYLGGKINGDFSVTKKVMSGNCLDHAGVAALVRDLNPTHLEALAALNELFTIAQAWNKADGFTSDYSDRTQAKWFPWFVYDKDRAGFVSADTSGAPSSTNAYIGSRLCFKTANRARQFGNQFIDLWNKVLLF